MRNNDVKITPCSTCGRGCQCDMCEEPATHAVSINNIGHYMRWKLCRDCLGEIVSDYFRRKDNG